MSRILIVEDEEAIAELEKDYLELNDFEVKIENSGDTGLATALAEEFDLIILDLMLPGIDGFEICKRIREDKDVPFDGFRQEGRYRQDSRSGTGRGRLSDQTLQPKRAGGTREGAYGALQPSGGQPYERE